jgi:hypothetical protein
VPHGQDVDLLVPFVHLEEQVVRGSRHQQAADRAPLGLTEAGDNRRSGAVASERCFQLTGEEVRRFWPRRKRSSIAVAELGDDLAGRNAFAPIDLGLRRIESRVQPGAIVSFELIGVIDQG